MIVDLIDWQAQFYRDKRLKDAELERVREEIASREKIASADRVARRDMATLDAETNRYRAELDSATRQRIEEVERGVAEAKLGQEEKNRKSRVLGDWLSMLGNLGKGFLGYELYRVLKDLNNRNNHNQPPSGNDGVWNNVRKEIQEKEKEVRKTIPDVPKAHSTLQYDVRPKEVDYRGTLHEYDPLMRKPSQFEKFMWRMDDILHVPDPGTASPVSAGAAAGAALTLSNFYGDDQQ